MSQQYAPNTTQFKLSRTIAPFHEEEMEPEPLALPAFSVQWAPVRETHVSGVGGWGGTYPTNMYKLFTP